MDRRADPPASPIWLRVLGGAVLALLGAGALYGLTMGLLRFGQIGVQGGAG